MSSSNRAVIFAGSLIGLAALAAYCNSFSGPFVYDDVPSILENPTIQHLWSHGSVLVPPGEGRTVSGRPLLNFSLAVNQAVSGAEVWSYHALNLAIHVLAGLALFGLVRRTLQRPMLAERFGRDALPVASGVALLWLVHPLQTESVTYVIQRAESLMGLCYLLTLYFFVRAVDSPRPGRWFALTFLACLSGMATKEVMVSAPLMVLLYDRTFVAGSFREAWRQRRTWHAGLAATWILLACLVASTGGNRDGTSGVGAGMHAWDYWLTQFPAIVHYLRLSFWPQPLVFEYGPFWVTRVSGIVPDIAVIVLLVAGTVLALARWPAVGFVAAWFWVMLAPTSLMPGAKQMMAEHRMYLSLAAAVVLGVIGMHRWLGRRSLAVCVLAALALGTFTLRRNEDYRSAIALWGDTAAKRPDNAIARTSLSTALRKAGRDREAIEQLEAILRYQPDFPELRSNLGHALMVAGRLAEARVQFAEAVRLEPASAAALGNLGNVELRAGRPIDAVALYERALGLKPNDAAIHMNLGNALTQLNRIPEAIEHYDAAIRIEANLPAVHYNYGVALAKTARLSDALAQFEAALKEDPGSARISNSLGAVLARLGRLPEAVASFERALHDDDNSVEAHYNLATVLQQLGRTKEAIVQLEAIGRIAPDFAPAGQLLAQLLEIERRRN